jgi:hypothetical protein
LHSLDGDSSATLQTMKAQTIPEYLEEERQKAADTRLRTEEETARIQPLRHGHQRMAKHSRLEMMPPVKAVTKKKKKTIAVTRHKPRGQRQIGSARGRDLDQPEPHKLAIMGLGP